MTNLTLPSLTVTLHDAPRSLPESRRVEYQCYNLVHSGIGSTMGDFDQHFERLKGLAGSDDLDAQTTAINNVRFLFANLIGKQTSPKLLAFCCLVEEVNGLCWADYSEEGVEKLAALLAAKGLTEADYDEVLTVAHKKIYSELNDEFPVFFPDGIEDRKVLEYKAMYYELDAFINPDDPTLPGRLSSLLYELQENAKPPVFSGENNQLKMMRSAYVNNKIALQMEHLPVTDETSSIQFWQYYQALEAKYKTKSSH